jgi:beta-lactamase regulating signal transducer with metallopeptidase domain
MTHFAELFSPSVMRPLGWALVHFVWEGAALAALLSVTMAMCRSARTRYALAVGTLVLMVGAPVATFIAARNAEATVPAPAAAQQILPAQKAASPQPALLSTLTTQKVSPDLLLLLVEVWMAGVLFLSLRNLGGLVLIERLRRKESKPVGEALLKKCMELQRRLGLDRVIRYCECHRLEAPAVIGWFRPVVLLPVTALTGLSEDQLAAVIAHELSHIQRLDCFVNAFQVGVETLLFYHPAVWWVSKRIRAERENCCDDAAIQISGDALQYARALTALAERRVAPSLAMAVNRSPLEARVLRLLGMEKVGSGIRTAGLAVSVLCLAGAVFAGNAILGTAGVSLGPGNTGSLFQTARQMVNAAPTVSRAASNATTRVFSRVAANTISHVTANVTANLQSEAATSAQNQETQESNSAIQNAKNSYIESLRAQGLENLSVDELVELKVQGVTADYVKGLHDLGLKPSVDEIVSMKVQGVTNEYVKGLMADGWKPSIDEIIAMKVQGITQDYAKAFSDLGLKPSMDELIALKVQSVTPDYIREMRANGVDGKVDEFIGMKVQGITPDYVKAIHDLGWKANADELVALKVQSVTLDYIREMRAAGLDGGAEEFIGMKVQGVTPDYVKAMHDLGLKPDADDIIGMKVQGVTPDYIRGIRATGLNPDKDDIIGMKVQGITPEYIKSLQAAGIKDITTDDVIGAKVQGITPEFIADAQKHGFKDLTLEKLIELKHADIF